MKTVLNTNTNNIKSIINLSGLTIQLSQVAYPFQLKRFDSKLF